MEYIEREIALSFPFANGKYDHENANEHFINGCETYKEWLETIPASDVRPVVLCRDCARAFTEDCCFFAKTESCMVGPDDDFFCANGQRRE